MIITLPYPPSKLNPNNRNNRNPRAQNSIAQKYKGQCFALMRSAMVHDEPSLVLKVTFHPRNAHPATNIDNAIAAFKSGLDAIAQAMGVDDARLTVQWPTEFAEPVKGGRVVVEA